MSENELHTISDNLHASHGGSLTNLEAGSLLDAETRRLSKHPTMADATGRVEYVRFGQEKIQRKEIQYVMECAEELLGCFNELESLNLTQLELTETPNWSEVFIKLDTYNQAIAMLDWKVLEPQEIDIILQKMISTENANRSLSFGSFSLLNIGTFITSDIPDDIFARQYHFTSSESELEQSLVRRYIANEMPATAHGIKAVLDRVYKKGPQFDAIAPGEDIVIDKLKGMISEVDFTIYSMEDEPQNSTEVEIRHYDERTAAKMDRVLLDLLKLPKIVVDRFYFAAMSRMQTQEHGEDAQYTHYDGDYIKESLRVINQLMQTFSVQSIDELSADMGVVNIDRYDTSDLLNLYALMHESDVSVKRREYLKQGDVTVVFCDAFGDYNRAFDPVASMYRGQLGRLLLFDVSTAEEIYRRMVQLKKHGIKPANVVIAAHGNPGTTGFGRLGKGFDFVSTAELANDKSVVLDEANLGRLASDEFMQPDKYGKRKIIIDSCSSAEEYPGVKSVAESILKSINRLDVVVYGADAVSTAGGNIDRGIKFSEYKPDSDEKARSTLVEMSLKRNDKIRTRALESLRFDERRQA